MTAAAYARRSRRKAELPSSHPAVIANSRAITAASPTRTDGEIKGVFAKLKQWRRIATRYEKLAANFLGFIKIASIMLWLK